MKKKVKRLYDSNKGFSLLEVICAVAVFSLVAFTIGSVVIVSARSYQNTVAETQLQQEAQFAANRISNIIQDASSVEYREETKELVMQTNAGVTYQIVHDSTANQLWYYDTSEEGTALGRQLLAEGITSFEADASDFEQYRTVKLKMQVQNADKTYTMNYTMTARNEVAQDIEFDAGAQTVGIWCEDSMILVPGETYQLPITVTGTVNNGIEAVSDALQIGAVTMDTIEITLPTDAAAETVRLTIQTRDLDAAGNPKASATVQVKVRRVQAVDVTHAVNRSATANGALEDKGAEYTFYADVTGTNLAKQPAAAWDSDYKKAQAVTWTSELKLGDTVVPVEDYFEEISRNEEVDRPSITYRLKEDMPSNLSFCVTATSKHGEGVNKAASHYAPTPISDSDTITPRATKITGDTTITLEPYQTGEVLLNQKGGVSAIRCELRDQTDTTTTAVYNSTKDAVVITLGKDERGKYLGYNSTQIRDEYNYEFFVDVYLDDAAEPKTTITVHVRRVDLISIEIKEDWYDDETNDEMVEVAYQFIVRFNVGNGKKNDKAMQYLTENKEDATKALAIQFTWELLDNTTNQVLYQDEVICMGDGTLIGSYEESRTYYTVSEVVAELEEDENGNLIGVNLPHINIHANYETGLPANTELKVTAVALHAEGGVYNSTQQSYGHAEATVSVKGEQTLETATDLVIVEPGQGTDDKTDTEHELAIPVYVAGGAVYRIDAKIEGKSDSDTRLAVYTDSNGQVTANPYQAANANSNQNKRTWWVGLIIGKEERGQNNDGLLTLTLTAYNSRNHAVATKEITLALRRVNEVQATVADAGNINSLNQAGQTITLEAYAKGYGEGGVEYYAIQKTESGEICRWETAGHGEYKSPYPMIWYLYENGTQTQLDKLTRYIDTSSIRTATDADTGKSTITFTLKQALPDGSEIRAVSLHALGEENGTVYNKSGKWYGTVYGSIKIGEETTELRDVNILRGRDGNQLNTGFVSHRSEYESIATNVRQRGFYRYREIGGTWNIYHRLTDSSETPSKLDYQESMLFEPEKAYELEVIVVVYSETDKKIYWPHDESLLEPGKGWYEDGYTKGWQDGQTTDSSEYKCNYYIGKTEVGYGANAAWGVSEGSKQFGVYNRENPIPLSVGDFLQIDLRTTYFSLGDKQSYFKARIHKLVDGAWVEESNLKWTLQTSCPSYQIYNIANTAEGLYRICIVLENVNWYTVTGSLMYPRYENKTITTELYNLYDDSGVIYVKFN